MTIPRENLLAAFPPEVKAGRLILRPLTIADAIRLSGLGIDVTRRVPDDKLLAAAWVMSGSDLPAERFFRRFWRFRCGLKALSTAVETALNAAFTTHINRSRAQAASPAAPSAIEAPRGLGWPLELAELLSFEYGWAWREALATPLITAFALTAAAHQRSGGRFAGLDYLQRQYAEDLKSGKAQPLDIH